MKTSPSHLVKSSAAAGLILWAGISVSLGGPQGISGNYTEAGKKGLVTVSDLGEGRYELKAPTWTGIGFWDESEKSYEGVFQYHDGSDRAGHQRIVKVTDDVIAVNWKESLFSTSGQGNYLLLRVEQPVISPSPVPVPTPDTN